MSSLSEQAKLAGEAFAELTATVELLRDPGGCPWDAEQTHVSLRPNLLEETYETLEAIDSGDPKSLEEELGDPIPIRIHGSGDIICIVLIKILYNIQRTLVRAVLYIRNKWY